VGDPVPGVAERIARRTALRRGVDYPGEVRRLLDAALEVMRACGTTSRPKVADIVAAAGLSNDAFYRHFASKDALVAAVLEDGTERLARHLADQLAKERVPEAQVRRWVRGVLAQAADDEVASTTLAVLWNAGGVAGQAAGDPFSARQRLGSLLEQPFAALGSGAPALDAALATHATMGRLTDYLWRQVRPSRSEIDRVAAFCLHGVGPPTGSARRHGSGGHRRVAGPRGTP
jgi:AcrR family transcriptional regulator